MFSENGGRPGDQRGFVHKSFIGKAIGKAVTTFVPGASTAVNVVKTGRSFFRGGRSPAARPTVPRTSTARPTTFSEAEKGEGKRRKFPDFTTDVFRPRRVAPNGGGRAPCDFPMEIAPDGSCREPTVDQFGRPLGVGPAVMGKYGAALEPGSQIIERAICLRGMQLGDDGLCYNKSQITNKQRMWPAGRKPLLSGGDMSAIGIAARAGRRLEGATKRLQRLGMMKKPASRRALPHAHAKAATGVVSVP